MARIETFLKELEREAQTTRKMLQRVPDDKYDWKPHAKSMSLRSLVTHIAELPSWIGMVLNTSELDFAAQPYQPVSISNNKELMAYFEQMLTDGKAQLESAKESQMDDNWTLRDGAQVYFTETKAEVMRTTFSQIIHHRAQLGVYLRLLDIPIPGSYGPSADEMGM